MLFGKAIKVSKTQHSVGGGEVVTICLPVPYNGRTDRLTRLDTLFPQLSLSFIPSFWNFLVQRLQPLLGGIFTPFAHKKRMFRPVPSASFMLHTLASLRLWLDDRGMSSSFGRCQLHRGGWSVLVPLIDVTGLPV